MQARPKRQRGLALLIAMLIVVIASTIAISIIYEEKFTIRKTGHIQMMDRAQSYAIGLEDWSRIYLREDREESKTDTLEEAWAQGIPGLPIEGGYLTGYLEDEQSRFNINTLIVSEVALKRFERLCDNLDIEKNFIPALMDWIDPDFDIRYPDGMEENYENYRVANRDIADISELLLVHNVTPEIYEKLKPHITALPPTATINVNTMSADIFESLSEEGDVSKFIDEREDEEFESIEDFIERMQIPVPPEGLSVGTNYFRAHGQVVQGEMIFNLTSLMYRDDNGSTQVLNRTLGQF